MNKKIIFGILTFLICICCAITVAVSTVLFIYYENFDKASDGEKNQKQLISELIGDGTNCHQDIKIREKIECYSVIVPENQNDPDSTDIRLEVVILKSKNSTELPVIYLEGGPGGSAINSLISSPSTWADLTFAETKDLIFIDQRGTGFSSPSLNCSTIEFEDTNEEYLKKMLECKTKFESQNINLSLYNTNSNATDIAAVIQALGYNKVDLYGISYGTRLAMVLMRDYPELINTVVLDSPYPPTVDFADASNFDYISQIYKLIEECGQDTECSKNYPDLESVFHTVLEKLESDETNLEISASDVIYVSGQALFIGIYAGTIPEMIYQLNEEDTTIYDFIEESIESMYSDEKGKPDSFSEGFYLSVICSEEYIPSEDVLNEKLNKIKNKYNEVIYNSIEDDLKIEFEICKNWGTYNENLKAQEIKSDIPTLIFVGGIDPLTTIKWAEITEAQLVNDKMFIIETLGHSPTIIDKCSQEIIGSLYLTSDLDEIDTNCLEDQENKLRFMNPNEIFIEYLYDILENYSLI